MRGNARISWFSKNRRRSLKLSETETHEDIYERIENEFKVSRSCATAIHYVSDRSRGTEDHLQRLIIAGQKYPDIDWIFFALRGEEADEMNRLGL